MGAFFELERRIFTIIVDQITCRRGSSYVARYSYTRYKWYGRWESNPHWKDFKSSVSNRWTTPALRLATTEGMLLSRPCPTADQSGHTV